MTSKHFGALVAMTVVSLSFLAAVPAADSIALKNSAAKAGEELHAIQFSAQFVGMHTLSPGRHWPAVPFGSIRPAGTSWGALEPTRDQYDWHSLDTWVAQSQAHHVQLDYVFVNTPVWASTKPTEACNGKRFGCAAPPNLDDWRAFVTALVTRYKGKISSYEMWNEPNGSGFWTGTPEQMVPLAATAYPIIKSIDPAAIVTTPVPSSSGWPMSHDAWLDKYLAAGGGKYADVVAWHGYAGRNDRPALPPEALVQQIAALRAVLAHHHVDLPIWNTEGGWGKNAQLPDPDDQAAFLVKWYLINFTDGIARAYWYQWDNLDWGTLWHESTGLTAAGKAADQVYGWLDGVTAASPCRQKGASSLWTCELKKRNVRYEVAWSASGQIPYEGIAHAVAFTPQGGERQLPGPRPVMIGSRPVLFELQESKSEKP